MGANILQSDEEHEREIILQYFRGKEVNIPLPILKGKKVLRSKTYFLFQYRKCVTL